MIYLFIFKYLIYLREKEGEREPEADSALSSEPETAGSHNGKIVTGAETKSLSQLSQPGVLVMIS